jgi:hypothetical protein
MLPISLCVCKCIPPIVARHGEHVLAATNTRNNRRIVGCVVFCAVHVVSKESLCVCLCIPLSLLGNGSVNTFSRQRGIVGGVVFYAVRVVSKDSRRLVLSRTSCYIYRRISWQLDVIGLINHIHQQNVIDPTRPVSYNSALIKCELVRVVYRQWRESLLTRYRHTLNPNRRPALPYQIRVLPSPGLRTAAVEVFFCAVHVSLHF